MSITIDGYPLDLVESEDHSLTAEITEHPVESGADVSDNIRLKPRELTLTNAVVSDTPIGDIATDDTRIQGDTLPPVSMDAYRRLEKIFEAREPVTVVTNLKKYENMALESLSIPRTSKTFGGLIFTAHFKEVRIVQNKRVTMALPNTGGEANYGLSLDKLINGKKILWRKGKPAGRSPSTVPAGVITGQEVVTSQDVGGTSKPNRYLHENGTPLTTQELNDFALDLSRDASLMEDRGLQKAENELNKTGTTIDRARAMNAWQNQHPSETPDPAHFGLVKDPTTGLWTSK